MLEQIEPLAADPGRFLAQFDRAGAFDVERLSFIDAAMFARVVTDKVPGIQAGQDGTGTGDYEGHAPRAQCSDQPGDDHWTQCCAKRCSTIEQGSAAAAFILSHPDRIQLPSARIT